MSTDRRLRELSRVAHAGDPEAALVLRREQERAGVAPPLRVALVRGAIRPRTGVQTLHLALALVVGHPDLVVVACGTPWYVRDRLHLGEWTDDPAICRTCRGSRFGRLAAGERGTYGERVVFERAATRLAAATR